MMRLLLNDENSIAFFKVCLLQEYLIKKKSNFTSTFFNIFVSLLNDHVYNFLFFIFYIWSWSLSEADRVIFFIVFILRFHATIIWFNMLYLQKISRVFSNNETNIYKIIKVFNIITKINTFIESQRYIYSKKLYKIILIDRKIYQ